MAVEAVLTDLLDRALDDWLSMPHVAFVSRSVSGLESDEEIRELALNALERGICAGFFEMGHVDKEAGFVSWSMDPSAAVERLRRSWLSGMTPEDLFGLGWARSTPLGDTRAKEARQAANPNGDARPAS